jgi:uncharacterized protein (TIGR03067 family)
MKAFVSIMSVLLVLNAHSRGEDVTREGDLGRVQGRWAANAGARREIQVVLEIKGREVSVAIKTPKGLEFQVDGELKLDETTSPRSLDWNKFTGPGQQPLPDIAAIYLLEGDTFTVRNGGFHGARPKDFTPGESVLDDLVVFRRLGPAGTSVGSKTAPTSPSTPVPMRAATASKDRNAGDLSLHEGRARRSPSLPASGETVSVVPKPTNIR